MSSRSSIIIKQLNWHKRSRARVDRAIIVFVRLWLTAARIYLLRRGRFVESALCQLRFKRRTGSPGLDRLGPALYTARGFPACGYC